VQAVAGLDFPDDAHEQMWCAIGAVFGSWMNDRAIVYRRQYNIPHEWGTAANICAMVFGNMGDDCCTGVAFTRDPASGENVFYGEYLTNAQGEDVVAGIRTPKKISELKDEMPKVYAQLEDVRVKLESHYKDVQDIEFTVQKGKLWMLQTRNGKRTGFAAVKFAVEMVEEGLIDWKTAIGKGRIPPDDLNQLLQPVFDLDAKAQAIKDGTLLAKGINAGPGAATGRIKFFAEDAGRADLPFLAKLTSEVIKAGATVVNLPDTTGYLLPNQMYDRITYLYEHVDNIHQARYPFTVWMV
jgi:pyruvate,orthophosphate dikinase